MHTSSSNVGSGPCLEAPFHLDLQPMHLQPPLPSQTGPLVSLEIQLCCEEHIETGKEDGKTTNNKSN